METHEELIRLHDEERREELAIRGEEHGLTRKQRIMERELNDLKTAEERTKRQIENEWRRERWGREPERPPVWSNPAATGRHLTRVRDRRSR